MPGVFSSPPPPRRCHCSRGPVRATSSVQPPPGASITDLDRRRGMSDALCMSSASTHPCSTRVCVPGSGKHAGAERGLEPAACAPSPRHPSTGFRRAARSFPSRPASTGFRVVARVLQEGPAVTGLGRLTRSPRPGSAAAGVGRLTRSPRRGSAGEWSPHSICVAGACGESGRPRRQEGGLRGALRRGAV